MTTHHVEPGRSVRLNCFHAGHLKRIDKVAILGGGLLGGSLALRLTGELPCSLWARREETVAEALSAGIDGATTDFEQAVSGADLIVLSVPVGAMPGLVDRLIDSGLGTEALVTDVGSVKRMVHDTIGHALAGAGIRFIGGHPMAGSESRGVASARADLFRGAACLLTDDQKVGEPWRSALEEFWKDVGCRVHWMAADAHDRLVARISHFPHVMAAATAMVALENPEDAGFGGGGLRDTTRVAGGDAAMWREILLENREAVSAAIRSAIESLGDVLDLIEKDDHEAVEAWLSKAQALHAAGRVASNVPRIKKDE